MEFLALISGLLLFAVASFLLVEEKNFRNGLTEIKGKVVGFSKGKSQFNKKWLYAVVEFDHPNGKKGWLESAGPAGIPLFKSGSEIQLETDSNDLHLTRIKRSPISDSAWLVLILAFGNFYFYAEAWGDYWKSASVLALMYAGAFYYFQKNIWKEQDLNLELIAAWRSFRQRIIRSRVCSENEMSRIQFWDQASFLQFCKKGNKLRFAQMTSSLVVPTLLWAAAYVGYYDNQEFMSLAKQTEGTIAKVHSVNNVVIEYKDADGKAHKATNLNSFEINQFKVGDKVQILFNPKQFNQVNIVAGSSIEEEIIACAILGFLLASLMPFVVRKMPKHDLKNLARNEPEIIETKTAV